MASQRGTPGLFVTPGPPSLARGTQPPARTQAPVLGLAAPPVAAPAPNHVAHNANITIVIVTRDCSFDMPYDMFIEKLPWLARDVPASPGSRYVLSRAGYDSEAFSSIRGWCHAKPPTFALGDTGEEGDILESFFESFKLGSTLYVDRFVNALFVEAGDVARKHDVVWRNTTIEEIYGRVDKDSRLKRWLINTWVEQRASLDSDHETLGCADDRALLEDFKWDCVRASAKRVVVDSKRGLTKAAAAKPYFEKPRTIPVRVVLDD